MTLWCTRTSVWRKPACETSIAGGRPRLLPGRVANLDAAGGRQASERRVGAPATADVERLHASATR